MMCIVVDREASPFEAREIPTLGFRQGHLGTVFENCRVPKANQLGEVGDAARILTLTWLANRPILGLCAVHMADAALSAALKYAGDRVQFGRPIGSTQLVQEMLADISTAVTTSRLLCYYALSCIDNGDAPTKSLRWPSATLSRPARALFRLRWKSTARWASAVSWDWNGTIVTSACFRFRMARTRS